MLFCKERSPFTPINKMLDHVKMYIHSSQIWWISNDAPEIICINSVLFKYIQFHSVISIEFNILSNISYIFLCIFTPNKRCNVHIHTVLVAFEEIYKPETLRNQFPFPQVKIPKPWRWVTWRSFILAPWAMNSCER